MHVEEGDRFLGVRCGKCGQPILLALKLSGFAGEIFRESAETVVLSCSRCLAVGVYPLAAFGAFQAHRAAADAADSQARAATAGFSCPGCDGEAIPRSEDLCGHLRAHEADSGRRREDARREHAQRKARGDCACPAEETEPRP